MENILNIRARGDFRAWLEEHHDTEKECWIVAKKGKVPPTDAIWYLDAVEEALCFGWIDTTHKNVDGTDMQKFTPRSKKSAWSELNKERCRRLERLGQMTDAGRRVLPDLSEESFVIDGEILRAFSASPSAWENFSRFPALYRRVRIDTIQRDKAKDRAVFERRLSRLIEQSEKNIMFGDWCDGGRLCEK